MGSRPLAVPASKSTRLATSPGSAEMLSIGESIVSSESADGLAFGFDKRKRGMCADSIPKFLEFAIDSPSCSMLA